MEFLYKLYSNQNFALWLFITIAVLLVLFIIVLIAAMKDTKKRKLEQLDNMEKEDLERIENPTFGEQVASFDESVEKVKEEDNSFAFFEDEEEQSKTRDITFDAPVVENSMSDLLSEFDAPIETNEQETSIQDLLEEANKENEEVLENRAETVSSINDGPSDDFFDLTQIDVIEPVVEKKEEVVFEPVQEDETEDDFELPAIKKEEENTSSSIEDMFNNDDVPEVKLEDLKKENINLEETGILDFSSIESESYEIK